MSWFLPDKKKSEVEEYYEEVGNRDDKITRAEGHFYRETVQGGRFDTIIKKTVTNLLMAFAIPWFDRVIRKYSEAEFHKKIDEGFDFRADWLANHRDKYPAFVSKARKMRRFFNFDTDQILDSVIKLLEESGWSVRPIDRERLHKAITEVRADIYGDNQY